MSSVLLKNIGTIVSGDISNPLLDGDAIFIFCIRIGFSIQ